MLSELFTGKKGQYSIATCDATGESCPINWATQRSDSDGGGYSLPTSNFVVVRRGVGGVDHPSSPALFCPGVNQEAVR